MRPTGLPPWRIRKERSTARAVDSCHGPRRRRVRPPAGGGRRPRLPSRRSRPGRRPAADPAARFSRAVVGLASPDAALRGRRLPRAGPRPARLQPLRQAAPGVRLRPRPPGPRRGRARRPRRRRPLPPRRPRLGRGGGLVGGGALAGAGGEAGGAQHAPSGGDAAPPAARPPAAAAQLVHLPVPASVAPRVAAAPPRLRLHRQGAGRHRPSRHLQRGGLRALPPGVGPAGSAARHAALVPCRAAQAAAARMRACGWRRRPASSGASTTRPWAPR